MHQIIEIVLSKKFSFKGFFLKIIFANNGFIDTPFEINKASPVKIQKSTSPFFIQIQMITHFLNNKTKSI